MSNVKFNIMLWSFYEDFTLLVAWICLSFAMHVSNNQQDQKIGLQLEMPLLHEAICLLDRWKTRLQVGERVIETHEKRRNRERQLNLDQMI